MRKEDNKGKKYSEEERKRWGEKFFSLTIFLLVISLGFTRAYLFIKEKRLSTFIKKDRREEELEDPDSTVSNWKQYNDEDLKYSIKYSSFLTPRKIASDRYLSFVVFFVTQGINEKGFAISVRENKLEEEAALIKEEIQKDISARLIEEKDQRLLDFPSVRLEYEPEEKEGGEEKTVVILNNGKYSYSVSASPDEIENIISNLDIW